MFSYENLSQSRADLKFCLKVQVLVTLLCLTLWTPCDPMDYIPPGSSVHGFSSQEYWSGLSFPFPGDLADPRVEPGSPALQADSLPTEPHSVVVNHGKRKITFKTYEIFF